MLAKLTFKNSLYHSLFYWMEPMYTPPLSVGSISKVELCSLPKRFCSFPSEKTILPLGDLSHAEYYFRSKHSKQPHSSIFSFPPPPKTQKVQIFGSKSLFQIIANRQEVSFDAHQASKIR